MIDLRYFDHVVLDPETWIANVGPGARVGNMALALYEQGGRAIVHGVCPR